jgi:ABC-type antimicrobial peptide transport system permease subunit
MHDFETLPGVEAVATVNRLPLLGGASSHISVYGEPERIARFVSIRTITAQYFDAVGVPLISGRWFADLEYQHGTSSIIINRMLARQLFADENPLGQVLDVEEGGSEVIGIVGDIMGGIPDHPAPPAIFIPAGRGTSRTRSVLVKTAGDPRSLITAIRATVEEQDSQIPIFGIQTLQDIALNNLHTHRFSLSLFGIFASFALFLGAMGIFSVMSFTVSQRSRELGIRLAMGATPSSLSVFIMNQSARVTIPGIMIGISLALVLARVLRSLLFEVHSFDPTTYLGVAVIFMVVALIAAVVPARRAAQADPLASIRNE